mmetsp:Transcript_18319/g.56192  ORF Transcript_18319/g.56192 Transcript_18319/m.56192 type:complete len:201 (-) Transcript_18319:312-914(-)
MLSFGQHLQGGSGYFLSKATFQPCGSRLDFSRGSTLLGVATAGGAATAGRTVGSLRERGFFTEGFFPLGCTSEQTPRVDAGFGAAGVVAAEDRAGAFLTTFTNVIPSSSSSSSCSSSSSSASRSSPSSLASDKMESLVARKVFLCFLGSFFSAKKFDAIATYRSTSLSSEPIMASRTRDTSPPCFFRYAARSASSASLFL